MGCPPPPSVSCLAASTWNPPIYECVSAHTSSHTPKMSVGTAHGSSHQTTDHTYVLPPWAAYCAHDSMCWSQHHKTVTWLPSSIHNHVNSHSDNNNALPPCHISTTTTRKPSCPRPKTTTQTQPPLHSITTCPHATSGKPSTTLNPSPWNYDNRSMSNLNHPTTRQPPKEGN